MLKLLRSQPVLLLRRQTTTTTTTTTPKRPFLRRRRRASLLEQMPINHSSNSSSSSSHSKWSTVYPLQPRVRITKTTVRHISPALAKVVPSCQRRRNLLPLRDSCFQPLVRPRPIAPLKRKPRRHPTKPLPQLRPKTGIAMVQLDLLLLTVVLKRKAKVLEARTTLAAVRINPEVPSQLQLVIKPTIQLLRRSTYRPFNRNFNNRNRKFNSNSNNYHSLSNHLNNSNRLKLRR